MRRVGEQNRMNFPQQWEVSFAFPTLATRLPVVVAGELVVVGVEREDHDAAEVIVHRVVRLALETPLVLVRDPLEAGGEERRAGLRVVFDADVEIAFLEPANFRVAGEAQHADAPVVLAGRVDPRVEGIHEPEGMSVSWQSDDDFGAVQALCHPVINGVVDVQPGEQPDVVSASVQRRIETCGGER